MAEPRSISQRDAARAFTIEQVHGRAAEATQRAWHTFVDNAHLMPAGYKGLIKLADMVGVWLPAKINVAEQRMRLKAKNVNIRDGTFLADWSEFQNEVEIRRAREDGEKAAAAAAERDEENTRWERTRSDRGALQQDVTRILARVPAGERRPSKKSVLAELLRPPFNWSNSRKNQGVDVTLEEVKWCWPRGGFLDISKCEGKALMWSELPTLEPLEQQPDGSGMVLFRTNGRVCHACLPAARCLLASLSPASGSARVDSTAASLAAAARACSRRASLRCAARCTLSTSCASTATWASTSTSSSSG